MAEQKIQLRKLRDFGENFNDTILFIRQNLKPLFKSFFAISSVFMVALAIFSGLYQTRTFNMFASVFRGNTGRTDSIDSVIGTQYFLLILSMLLLFVTMQVALGAYLKYYVENDGKQPGIDDVWVIFRRYFFKILFYSIPFVLVSMVGLIFCIAPGIYCWVLFSPFPLVVMIEDRDFVETYERCIDLLKGNFWISFAIYLVGYMIYSVGNTIFAGAGTMILAVAAYFSTDNIGDGLSIATSFLSIFSYCFYIVYFISVALNYFSLAENQDGTGLLNRINNIGTGSAANHNTEEQY